MVRKKIPRWRGRWRYIAIGHYSGSTEGDASGAGGMSMFNSLDELPDIVERCFRDGMDAGERLTVHVYEVTKTLRYRPRSTRRCRKGG